MGEILVVIAVLVGAALQRVTGVGFALVVAPFLVLLLGAVDGVLLVNVTGALTSGLILLQVRRRVEWRRYAVIAPASLIGIAWGAMVVAAVPAPMLELGIGLLLAAVLTLTLSLRSGTLRPTLGRTITIGALSGLMNTAAGLGGPAVTAYAIATRWPQESFRATAQAFFFTIACLALAAKLGVGGAALPEMPVLLWVAVAVASVLGMLLGARLVSVLPVDGTRIALFVVSYLGAAATIARGAVGAIA